MKQTPNYNLPQFDGEDKFNKEDFNDAFNKLDTAISDLQETFNTTASDGALTTQEVINARKGKPTLVKKIDEIDNNIVNVNEQLEHIATNHYIDYFKFGAIGDGIVDDTEAIYNAHIWANEHKVDIQNKSGIFKLNTTKVIPVMTNCYLYGTKFIINEAKNIYFEIKSRKEKIVLDAGNFRNIFTKNRNNIRTLKDYNNSMLFFEDISTRVGKRYNTTQDFSLQDFVIIDNGGNVSGDIIHDIPLPTNVEVYPFDDDNIVFNGANFDLICDGEVIKDYPYTLLIRRSNVTLNDVNMIPKHSLLHSSGSVYFERCANITFNNCNFTPRIPLDPMKGSYGIGGDRCINITFNNCRGASTTLAGGTDNYWGVMGTNLIKNLLINKCNFNRVDCHFQAYNIDIINSEIGNRGITLCGGGHLNVENTKITSLDVLLLRTDYGSRWNGDIKFKNIEWTPFTDEDISLIEILPDGQGSHDFGYDLMLGTNTVTFENIKLYQLWNDSNKIPLIKFFNDDVFTGDYYLANKFIFKDIEIVNRKNTKGFVFSNNNQLYKFLNKNTTIDILIDNVMLHDFNKSNPYSITGMNSIGHFIIDKTVVDNIYNKSYQVEPTITFKNLNNLIVKARGIRGKINIEKCVINFCDSYGYKLHTTNQISNKTFIKECEIKPLLSDDAYFYEDNRNSLIIGGSIINSTLYPMYTTEYKNEFTCYKYLIDTIAKTIGKNELDVLTVSTNGVTIENFDLTALGLDTTNIIDVIKNNSTKSYDRLYGTTAQRPVTNLYITKQYFDTTLNKLIWWSGTEWRDSLGTIV